MFTGINVGGYVSEVVGTVLTGINVYVRLLWMLGRSLEE
jgi:hypothetical protein